ncbi:PDZ/DHR/GLGF domain protein [Candidatus Omnitrophus magneticus]|uniref:PDZ/DHR/GLGF domain protein n=1 Tax=Candidatus Omnitrophus magneticus TaxID=1609969 RepID=A0A0F0CSD5_9BACT|nr:PDZ/DHR/GLGF domain protein [Candidatus Omnitrophus magneticus]
MQDSQEIKGVVVEEYDDRVILSTIDGEQEIMREKIKELIFDRDDQNYINLAEYYQERKAYEKSYYYYKKALEINPSFKKAREGILYVSNKINNSDEVSKISHVKKLNETTILLEKGLDAETSAGITEELKHQIGITIEEKNGLLLFKQILAGSPADKAGLRERDTLIAIWAKATRYMNPTDIYSKFLSNSTKGLHITYGRIIKVKLPNKKIFLGDLLGARLEFILLEGLTVKEVKKNSPASLAGICKNDIILEIDKTPIRYVPINTILEKIAKKKGATVEFLIKRDTIIWK